MAKKEKGANAQPERGDTIATIRNGQRIFAVITETDGGLKARACSGDEFIVDAKKTQILP